MPLSEEILRKYNKRILLSKLRILMKNGFYGLLLMHMIFAIDEKCETVATDGVRIYLGPKFVDDLSDKEFDLVLMHEILHVVLNHCKRQGERENEAYSIACDIVVNSNILYSNNFDVNSITLREYGELVHTTPNGDEGYKYTAEEVYKMLPKTGGKGNKKQEKRMKVLCDDHSRWNTEDGDDTLRDVWIKRMADAAESVSVRAKLNAAGTLPFFAKRMLENLRKPQTDWRTILSDFIQEEICDYSFSPPDRRFGDLEFFLPDFNDTDIKVSDILFMIDTSASMSDAMVMQAYSEVKGAIDQFGGKLCGHLGFFDAEIVEPKEFQSEDEFKIIKPVGGGGTDFQVIFDYVQKRMNDNLPASIIILTDGYAPFPNESAANGIPVLWLINNEDVTPPWGRVARVKVEGN